MSLTYWNHGGGRLKPLFKVICGVCDFIFHDVMIWIRGVCNAISERQISLNTVCYNKKKSFDSVSRLFF